jgi:hypothetical protein
LDNPCDKISDGGEPSKAKEDADFFFHYLFCEMNGSIITEACFDTLPCLGAEAY